MKELVCPNCGGEVEERGNVRCYIKGKAVLRVDGTREWTAGAWVAPIETLVIDEPPFHCLDCDVQHDLSDLVAAASPALSRHESVRGGV